MKILLFTPTPPGSKKGNRITAIRWARILRGLGHRVDVVDGVRLKTSARYDCMIALHAKRAHQAIVKFQKQFPDAALIVCLTGTDLHADLQNTNGAAARRMALDSVQRADKLVMLEPQGRLMLPSKMRAKAIVIFQSARKITNPPAPLKSVFEVTLIGHLRAEKDPFLAARAAAGLPETSRVRIIHIGVALNAKMKRAAESEMKTNARYRWLGQRDHAETLRRLARSQLMVLTSKIEGAPSAISEAIVNRVPILATRIPATLGMMGPGHPGLFKIGSVVGLRRLMQKAECDSAFLKSLTQKSIQLQKRFSLEAEVDCWRKLISAI